jgi:hypothetical protein
MSMSMSMSMDIATLKYLRHRHPALRLPGNIGGKSRIH